MTKKNTRNKSKGKRPKHYNDPGECVPAGEHRWRVFAEYLENDGFQITRKEKP